MSSRNLTKLFFSLTFADVTTLRLHIDGNEDLIATRLVVGRARVHAGIGLAHRVDVQVSRVAAEAAIQGVLVGYVPLHGRVGEAAGQACDAHLVAHGDAKASLVRQQFDNRHSVDAQTSCACGTTHSVLCHALVLSGIFQLNVTDSIRTKRERERESSMTTSMI